MVLTLVYILGLSTFLFSVLLLVGVEHSQSLIIRVLPEITAIKPARKPNISYSL
jgi:hypothetical protein